jgi:hypothetical protein
MSPFAFASHSAVSPLARLHWSAMRLKYRATSMPIPISVDYLSALPADLGQMGNDEYGDCFEAALYHGDQVRTYFALGKMMTAPDAAVLGLYSAATGFDPGNPASDQGSDPAAAFAFVEKNGLPGSDGGAAQLLAAFEIDPRNFADVMTAMDACGGLMVGIDFPSSVGADPSAPVWDVVPGATIEGGHEILVAAKPGPVANFGFVSWGNPRYQMTPAFWAQYVNQCTAGVWSDWFEATGKSPFGMTEAQLLAETEAMQSGPTP